MHRLHLAQAVVLTMPGEIMVCSGQPSVDESGHVIGAGDIRLQTETAMANLGHLLASGGFSLGDLIRINLYTTDVTGLTENFGVIADILRSADCYPANTLLGVQCLARPDMMIEIEATAAR